MYTRIINRILITAYAMLICMSYYRYGFSLDMLDGTIRFIMLILTTTLIQTLFILSNQPLIRVTAAGHITFLVGFLILTPFVIRSNNNNVFLVHVFVGVAFGCWCLFILVILYIAHNLKQYDFLYKPIRF